MKITKLLINHEEFAYVDSVPEFSWTFVSDANDTYQKAYRLLINTNDICVFDSGIIETDKQNFIVHDFKLLEKTTYKVTLYVWDNYFNVDSIESTFETGFLSFDTLKAKWIKSPFERLEDEIFKEVNENHPISLSKKFRVPFKIKTARLYSTCYGIYTPYLNDEKITNSEFLPDFTPYDKALNYQVFNLTEKLKEENKISFTVANGWFFSPQTKVITSDKVDNFALLYQLEIYGVNGEKLFVYSDGNEECVKTNIIKSDIFRGQITDLTYNSNEVLKPIIENYKFDNLRVQPMPSVSVVETFKPVKYFKSPKGEHIIDFGQVIAGRIKIKINEEKNKIIKIYQTEELDKDGNYFEILLNSQCDQVITNGEEFVFEPHYTFHGFRYIKVEGISNINLENFEACLLSTPKENRSSFTTSNELLNRLYKNIRYSQTNNTMSIPTDCPQREKAGWTGDMYVYSKTALNNENMIPFLTSWIKGLSLDQLESGVVPIISPYTNLYRGLAKKANLEAPMEKEVSNTFSVMDIYTKGVENGVAGWGDAIVEVPYNMYIVNGDTKILNDLYPSMKKWCDYIIDTANNNRGSSLDISVDKFLYNTGFHFGEWLVPGKKYDGFSDCKVTAKYIAPFFAEHTLRTFSSILGAICKDDESKYYREMADNFKGAIIKGIFDMSAYDDSFIGFYAIAFIFDLVPEKYYDLFKNKLVDLVIKSNCTIGTGFLGTPYILDALEKIGRTDLIKKILLNENSPSWLYEVKMNATTIWERWDAIKEDGTREKTSYDHYAFGIVDDYILRKVVGIVPTKPGYKNFSINPTIDLGLTYFKRTLNTDYGQIVVEKKDDVLYVEVPSNTTCTITYNEKTFIVGSGKYKYE